MITHQDNNTDILISVYLGLVSILQLVSKLVQREDRRVSNQSQNSWVIALAMFIELSSSFFFLMSGGFFNHGRESDPSK